MELGFIDFNDDDRKKITSVLELEDEKITLDKLGLGITRDAFADLLFPGISTLQTRAKYFLTIPYLFSVMQKLMREYSVSDIKVFNKKYLKKEIEMTRSFMEVNEETGIIGSSYLSRKNDGSFVRTTPSDIYFNGAKVFEIVRNDKANYKSIVELLIKEQNSLFSKVNCKEGYDDLSLRESTVIFEPYDFNDSFFENGILLSHDEAVYLIDRINTSVKTEKSLLKLLVNYDYVCENFDSIPIEKFNSEENKSIIKIYKGALAFSNIVAGIHTRYNVILYRELNKEDEYQKYCKKYNEWIVKFESSKIVINEIYSCFDKNAYIKQRQFVDDFIKNYNNEEIVDQLIMNREVEVKKARAQLKNVQQIITVAEQNKEVVKFNQEPDEALDFRYGTVKQILLDIKDGLKRC